VEGGPLAGRVGGDGRERREGGGEARHVRGSEKGGEDGDWKGRDED